MTSPEYQAPTWVNEDHPDFIEGVSPDLGAGYLNQLSGAVEDHGQRLGAAESDVANLQATALDQADGDARYILQSNAAGFAPAEATANALAGKQSLDADLTALAGLDSATAGTVASDGAGWVKKTYAQLKTALGLATIATSGKIADAADLTTTDAAVGMLPAVDQVTGGVSHFKASRRALNVRDFGAVGDGTTDDTAAIQAAIEAARLVRGAVYVPGSADDYVVSSALLVPSRLKFYGDGPYKTAIRQVTADTPVIASRAWDAPSAYGPGGGCEIKNLRINGATGTSAHGIVLRDYYSEIENVHVYDTGGNGIHVTDKNSLGTAVGSTLVENKIKDVVCNRCIGWGIYVGDTDTVATTDGFLVNIVIQSRSAANGSSLGGIRFGSAAGWQLRQIHTYGSFTSYGVDVSRCWHAVLDGVQIERGWVGAGLRMASYQRGSSIDNISISCDADGGNAIQVDGVADPTYLRDGINIGSVTIIQDFDGAVTALSWSRPNARMNVGALTVQGTFQNRVTAKGGFAGQNILIANGEAAKAISVGSLGDDIATMPRLLAGLSNIILTSGTLRLAYFTAPQQVTLASLRVITGTTAAAATPTLCRLGLYEVASNGDLTLVASTANDVTLFNSASATASRAPDVPYDVRPGRRYAIGALVVTTATAPWVCGATGLTALEMSRSPRIAGFISGMTDLPATATAATVTNSSSVIYGALSAT